MNQEHLVDPVLTPEDPVCTGDGSDDEEGDKEAMLPDQHRLPITHEEDIGVVGEPIPSLERCDNFDRQTKISM